jgi:TrmH family RNA methyltransferase
VDPRIVLVRPLYGGNVGSSARAMANMGLGELILVKPQFSNQRELELMAKGAGRIIEQTRTFDELSEAVSDCTTVIACTARPRRWKAWELLDPEPAAQLLAQRGSAGEKTALLFGSEDRGLEQSELVLATHLCHIPTGPEHSSLNLSQAVLLLGWEYARALGDLKRRPYRSRRRATPTMDQVVGASDQVAGLLDRIRFFAGRNREQSLATIRQALLRSEMTETEIHFLRGVVNKLRWWLDHGPRTGEAPDAVASPASEPDGP